MYNARLVLVFIFCLNQVVYSQFQCDSTKQKKFAICYWGLTRSTKFVYQSHENYLYSPLREHGILYDVFMHTWDTGATQWVWDNELTIPIDYEEYKFLHPNYYKIDDQDVFSSLVDPTLYHGKSGYMPRVILNLFCALESQRRVTEMVLDTCIPYDAVIYVRPDVMIESPIPIEIISNINKNEIIIPNRDHYGGYNDRFAVLALQTAAVYGMRINGLAEYGKEQQIASEPYLKYVCDVNNIKATSVEFNFRIIRPNNIYLP